MLKNCGSSLTLSASDNDVNIMGFSLETLDVDIEHKPDANVYVAK